MPGWYAHWIENWEHRLASRDTNRQTLPFEWGFDWLDLPGPTPSSAEELASALDRLIPQSDSFFSHTPPDDFRESPDRIEFTSPLASPYPENNTVRAYHFPAREDNGRAVVVLPQWNADANAHHGLCRLLNRFGISSLRMTTPYHDCRMPAGQVRADYHVSGNLGRTIHAIRQAVIDARCCLDWLEKRGYRRLGIIGTSLGSCISFVTAAHDERVRAGVFNHVSAHFGDVVWTGMATQHVRRGLDGRVSLDELRRIWNIISPATYVQRFTSRDFRALLVWGRYDPVFRPELSRDFLSMFPGTSNVCLPCGHYTLGQFPFNWIDGGTIVRFLRKYL
jgi:pimeloyl-ACP methyl ester carboxylesterase